jgi:hypothetical protein
MRFALLVLVASACFAQESLTLADAEALALRQHPQIAGARLITQASGLVTKEIRSNLYPTLKNLNGIAKDKGGEPMASAEWVVVIVLPRKDGTGEVNVTVRGMMPDGLEMRQLPADKPRAKLVAGRWFSPGQREVVVSSSSHKRFSNSNVGDTMQFGRPGRWWASSMRAAARTSRKCGAT